MGGVKITKGIIAAAKKEKRNALTEAQSKQILSGYGIPVVEEIVALRPDDAANAADKLGYPVVLKGLGSKLTHKTERGLVYLNISTREAVLAAANDISRSAGDDLEGYLVQPMVRGRREFVAGLFCDAQFGPVVMFGLGGIFTEALDDVVFRVAPVSEVQAQTMLEELRLQKLLGPFRGEAPVDRKKIIDVILGLSQLAMECPDIVKVDVNPLVADATGGITAVDALIILGKRIEKKLDCPSMNPQDIFNIFAPKSIAFVGASGNVSKWGYRLLANTVAGGYTGEIYLVNSNNKDIAGRKVYKSLSDIPGPVDLAAVTIPASQVMDLIPVMKEKGIKYMLLISSGFSEAGDEGTRMEKELAAAAKDAGILIVGPNTMGFINPHEKVSCVGTIGGTKPGSVGLITQSGNFGTQLTTFAEKENIGLRVFCGSGNGTMITIEDYLGAFEVDEKTDTISLYVEGVKDGRRFLQQAERVSRKKPIVLLKGGRTAAGNTAAASHTGAMASNIRVFDAACRQAGIILARQPVDLLDFSADFSSLPLPRGNRVALVTLGGGWGVVAADQCSESGLTIPPLSADIISRIDKILPPYWNRGNPVDLVGEFNFDIATDVVEMLAEWNDCDAIILLGMVGMHSLTEASAKICVKMEPGLKQMFAERIEDVEKKEKIYIEYTVRMLEKYRKPIIGVTLFDGQGQQVVTDILGSKFKGVFLPTAERAINALAAMVQYGKWLKREGIQK
jgi:acyl-CoA synthetase (NDP forming)